MTRLLSCCTWACLSVSTLTFPRLLVTVETGSFGEADGFRFFPDDLFINGMKFVVGAWPCEITGVKDFITNFKFADIAADLPKGALMEGLRKASPRLELPELPMYSVVLITDEQKGNEARDVFITSHLKVKILVQNQGGPGFQPEGILWLVAIWRLRSTN